MCLGENVDKLPGAKPPGSKSKWVPTVGESVDPHYMRTNSKAEERHKQIGVHAAEPPPPPATPVRPQGAKAPNTQPLKRRNNAGGPAYSETMLTGPSGVTQAQLNLGASTLLG
jgi:hypothetical protein